jgi:hypothetical protein
MLFNLETDTGDRITGYLVPDGYSEVPAVLLRGEGQDSRQGTSYLGLRDNLGFRSAIDFAEHLLAGGRCFDDRETLRQRPRKMPYDAAASLANPLPGY